MSKKPVKAAAKPKSMTADDHRKLAAKHSLKSRMHEVKADMLDVEEPPKKGKSKGVMIRPY